jgi:hypothetical protein
MSTVPAAKAVSRRIHSMWVSLTMPPIYRMPSTRI